MLRFVGDGDQKKFTKSPRHFSMQNSQANTTKKKKKYSQNSSGEQRQSKDLSLAAHGQQDHASEID